MARTSIESTTPPPEPTGTKRLTRRWILVAAGTLLVVGAVAFAVFRPDRLVIDKRVDEQLSAEVEAAVRPSATMPTAPGSTDTPPGETAPTIAARPAPVQPAQPEVVGRGSFVSQGGHTVNGTAVVLRNESQRLLVLPDLDSQNGPDLQLYLSPRAEGSVTGGVRLGPLKGNLGTQAYELPDDLDLSVQRHVVIWCERFSVPFGTVTLAAG